MALAADRLATIIQRELAGIVNNKVKDTQVGYINLTEVKVTKDQSYSTIYYTILSDDKTVIEKASKLLEENKVSIRMDLAKKINNVRRIPDLIFKYDEALAYGNRIEDILKTLK